MSISRRHRVNVLALKRWNGLFTKVYFLRELKRKNFACCLTISLFWPRDRSLVLYGCEFHSIAVQQSSVHAWCHGLVVRPSLRQYEGTFCEHGVACPRNSRRTEACDSRKRCLFEKRQSFHTFVVGIKHVGDKRTCMSSWDSRLSSQTNTFYCKYLTRILWEMETAKINGGIT